MRERSSADTFPILYATHSLSSHYGRSHFLRGNGRLCNGVGSPATMLSPVQNPVHFADFEVDLRAGELRKQGTKVRLQEQPFRVLTALLESSGEVVTREELRSRLWPADTFVDFDHRLAAAISKLREALEDSAESPRFIETVGRRGYRFLLPVQPAGPPADTAGDNEAQASLELPPATSKARGATWPRVALAAGALALLLLLGFVFLQRWWPDSALPHISSIAVLPLENLSNDPEQEYFVEGMTDEIITDLAKLPGIRVISRTSAVQYKNTHKTLPQIARELNVDAVVEGTVLREGNRVRIRTQLVYAPTDRHIWAQAYERDLKDVLTLQANLAQDIAGEIQLKLTSQQRANLAAAHSVDPEAHEFYLKGRYFWNKRDQEGFTKAIDYFQQAIAKDPAYAAAYAGLADSYALSGGFNLIPVGQAMPRAQAAAEKALELDGNLAEAHASLGLIAPFSNWAWDDAKRHYERAIELNPNYATAHHWYAEGYLMPVGRADEAITEIRKAQELDPLSPVIATDLGKELYFVRKYDEALVELRRALELNANFVGAHNWISDTLLEKGMYREAVVELEKTKPFKEERVYIRQTAYLYARSGRQAEARAALAKSLQLSQGKPVSSGAVALTYAALGDKEQAFSWLEKAYTERSSFMTSLKYWSVFDPLRGDPRFADLLRRVGLPQ
jgi:TolB-like protein/DNA-binding winged helix-turn-helix (wHTH) protein/Flp pilus assembly protein TadD